MAIVGMKEKPLETRYIITVNQAVELVNRTILKNVQSYYHMTNVL